MYYKISTTLERCDERPGSAYVAVLTGEEWIEESAGFDMGIELEVSAASANSTKVEVNYDSLTGTFSIPDRDDISAPDARFAFALDEKGIVFIDDSGTVQTLINSIASSKR